MRRSLFVTKDLTALAQSAPQGASGRGQLGALDLTLLGIGCIMGTGVFVLTGKAAALYAGPAVMLSFVLAAGCAGLAAMCFAEMASMLPVSGSAYVYAYATMGELPAFWMGWNLALQYLVGAAAVAGGWSGYVCALAESLGLPQLPAHLRAAPFAFDANVGRLVATGATCNLPAMGIIVALCAVLVRGLGASTRLNAAMVAIKMVVVLSFVGFALPHVVPGNWQPFVPPENAAGAFGPRGVVRAATLLFFAYLGFDAVSVAAADTKNPKRDVPVGILASLGVCVVLYVATAACLTGVVPYTQLDVASPMAVGVAAIGRPWLIWVVNLGALAGLTSVLLVQLFAAPRILLAMAQDGLLGPWLAKGCPRRHAPVRQTWVCGAVCALGAGFFPVEVLADITSLGTLLVFALVGLGVLILRRTRPEMPRKFRVPLGTYPVPLACIGSALALLWYANTGVRWLLLYMAVGTALYLLDARPRLQRRDGNVGAS